MPNESLTLEWFYMTFHKSERDQFITSGRRLVDKTIEFVTEYFESLYNIKKSSGKLKIQLEQRDHKKYEAQRGTTKNRYDDKMRNMADERRTSHSCSYRDNRNRNHGSKTYCNSNYKRDKSERKAPPEFSGKPCHVHGDKAKHTYQECRDNSKNRKSSSGNRDDNNNRKRSHDTHHHDERYLSSQDESPDDHRTPEPSDDEGTKSSASSGDGQRDEENYHVDTGKVPRKKRKVGVVQRSASCKDLRNKKPSHPTKHVTHSLLQDELDEDTTRVEIADDVTNPFAFK